ncbi:MAG: RNA polymerase sigma factor [Acidobacteria bacterium]|nr:MAG: RNA polymerase sigma factor [Acidobacteriota bacterium]
MTRECFFGPSLCWRSFSRAPRSIRDVSGTPHGSLRGGLSSQRNSRTLGQTKRDSTHQKDIALPDTGESVSVSELEDRELIKLCRGNGSVKEQAWEEVVRRFRRRVFGIAYKFTGRYEESQDLTQEIFLRVFRSLDKFDANADFGTWLYSVSRNHCIDHYRSGRRERESLVQHEVHLEEMASGRFDPYRAVEVRDKREMLLKALSGLPDKLREAVMLRDIKELTYQEIVEQLELPEGTVKSRINRGRLELGRALVAMRNRSKRANGING